MADGSLDQDLRPSEEIAVRDMFGIESDMTVKAFPEPSDRVPEIDPTYKFDRDT
ncbi:MAG: cobaltochelatase subunit CobS, partial [Pseudomonadota bacterium]